jgi:hypothetical protein
MRATIRPLRRSVGLILHNSISHINVGGLWCLYDVSHAMLCPPQERSRRNQGCFSILLYLFLPFNILPQVVLARSPRCPPPKPANTVMPKSILSPSMCVHFLSVPKAFPINSSYLLRFSLERSWSVRITAI